MMPALLLSALLPRLASAVTGQGPRGVQPINDRYVAVVDSSIDSVLIVDGNSGGAVVGHVVLHDRSVDGDPSRWLNPVSVATCDECEHLYVLSPYSLHAIALDRPLLAMADDMDFASLAGASVRPYWPDGWSEKYGADGRFRSVSVAHDGSSAYVAHASGGIFSFDPFDPSESSKRAKHVIKIGQADVGEDISGLHHTSSLRNLVVTRSKYVHIVKLEDDEGENPLEYGQPVAYELALDYHCHKLYQGAEMTFVDAVIINEYAFVMGHPTYSDEAEHNGMSLYRLTWYEDDEAWHDCEQIAGDGLKEAGWADGSGRESRFSATPHDIAVLPTLEGHVIVVADVDNRALRYVDVTVPVESHDRTDRVRVSSVAYDEDLYQVLYAKEAPWDALTPEAVMVQDGKSYYHSGEDSLYAMDFDSAQDECGRVGIGRICTLPEIRARFARGQYPTVSDNDDAWTTVWTAETCAGCHLERPGRCPLGTERGADDSWGQDHKMIAVFNPRAGLQTQCISQGREVQTMSMCCGLGGPAVLGPNGAAGADGAEGGASQGGGAGAVFAGVAVPLLLVAAAAGYGLYMRQRPKPSWWPAFLRNDRREEDTGHAPHREVDLRGRDYI